MSKVDRSILIAMLIILLAVSCTAPDVNQPKPTVTIQPTLQVLPAAQIARYPAPADLSRNYMRLDAIPKFDLAIFWQVDLRSRDLTEIDMTESLDDLLYAVFDSKTEWPSSDKFPPGFDWQKIMETGKDPGLGIRALHDQGITGRGVNIAIIDQPLIIEHVEYADRIRLYEEISIFPGTESQMHGPAVASIAVGKNTGVAPDANVYYIATMAFDPKDPEKKSDYSYIAQAIHRILEINKDLPADQKIRAISMSIGLNPAVKGYDEFSSAIEAAKKAGVFPINVSLDKTYNHPILGMGRDPRSDPNDFQFYRPASWWKQEFFDQQVSNDRLLIPMEARTTASPTGAEDYAFYDQAGMSWSVPYLAGMYALAVQVNPDITPEDFLTAAIKTGKTIPIRQDGRDYEFGVILDPRALIEEIKGK